MTETLITKNEWQVLDHRLACADTLADCFSSEGVIDYHVAYQAAEDLRLQLEADRVIKWGNLTQLQTLILIDCISGSTYMVGGAAQDAVAIGELNKGEFMSMCKAMQSLERKFEDAGHRVFFPDN